MRRLKLVLVLILATSSFRGVAQAQANPRQLAEANRAAMDAYNNLEIEQAKETLERAIAGAESNGLTGSGLARTYANLGVVEIGGFSDSAAALEAFVRALEEDSSVEPDPLVSTPEVLQVFAQAKRKAGQGGKRAKPAPVAAAPVAVEGNLEHVPAAEQLKNTDLPVFVAASNPEIASMKIFYRSTGLAKPKSAAMRQTADGFSYLIPCGDVFQPAVEYFVLAFDAAGEKIGNAGTPENPVSVPIVSERSQPAPSLPGETPPTQCGGGEAAVVAGPSVAAMGHEGSLGDTCHSDSDCGEGLMCSDNFCALGSRSHDDDDDDDKGEGPRFYTDVNIGVSGVLVTNKSATDASPPPALINGVAAMQPLPGLDAATSAQQRVADQGWACHVAGAANGGLAFSSCKTNVASSGFVAVPVLNVAVGYYLSSRFALAGLLRYQFDHGKGSIGLAGGLRADILLTKPVEKGFHTSLTAGILLGRIQAKAPKAQGFQSTQATQDGGTTKISGPYASSGPFGLQFGLRMGYRFTRNVGLVVTPAANLMLGNFLFALDLTGGLTFAF
jgi:hypothetical protein